MVDTPIRSDFMGNAAACAPGIPSEFFERAARDAGKPAGDDARDAVRCITTEELRLLRQSREQVWRKRRAIVGSEHVDILPRHLPVVVDVQVGGFQAYRTGNRAIEGNL